MKIAIAGPGRSGTSFLVKMLGEWGFNVPNEKSKWHDDSQAGLENRINATSEYEVDKDPWLFEYISRLEPNQIESYDAFIIPIRSLVEAASSRSIQERYARSKASQQDHWQWNTWGVTPGGAIGNFSIEGISRSLTFGLWEVIEKLSAQGVQPIILNFPRIVSDFEYLWKNIGHLVSPRISKEEARGAFEKIADTSKIRTLKLDDQYIGLQKSELVGLIETLRKDIAKKENQLILRTDERDAAYATKAFRWGTRITNLTHRLSSFTRKLSQEKKTTLN